MKLLTRDLKLAQARKTVTVDIPEMECSVRLKELSISQVTAESSGNLIDKLALMIVDENDQRIYTTPEDLNNLAELSASVTMRLATAAAKLNGMSQEAVEEVIKKSQASQSGDSA